jgi:hypothetical protein
MVRAYPRYATEGTVNLRVPDSFLNNLLDAGLDNISFGGFAMNSPLKINVDTDISFKLRSCLLDEVLPGKGRIRYIREDGYKIVIYRMGVEFTEVNKDVLKYLITKLQHYAKTDQRVQAKKEIIQSIDLPF